MFLSNIFRHMVHTLIFRSGFRVLCSVFMTAINYIKMMKKKKQNVLLYMISPKVLFFLGCCCSGHPLKLLAEPRWNRLGVADDAKYQIRNPKSVLYESEMNTIWLEVAQNAKWRENEPWAVQQYFSPDGINE